MDNLHDYYPVYKDVSDKIAAGTPDHLSSDSEIESEFSRSILMLNADQLTTKALKSGFSVFQTVILLFKNLFEGHVFLTWGIKPDQLFNQGTLLFRIKPESMVLNFYNELVHYRPGLNEIWSCLREKTKGLGGISFDLIIHTLIVNHVLRFPVSIFSLYDIRSFSESLSNDQKAMDQRFVLALLGESALGEWEFIRRVNTLYGEKFKEAIHQLSIKEKVYSHYKRKLDLSVSRNFTDEKELDDMMYKLLVDDEVSKSFHDKGKHAPGEEVDFGAQNLKLRFPDKIKACYRLISKNCVEIHSTADGEKTFPELNTIFILANSIYNESVSDKSDNLLQYMRLSLLLSEVVIFRKTKGYPVSDHLQIISDFNAKEVLNKDYFMSLKRNLEISLVEYRTKSLTDFKMKFVMDDEFTDIHNYFLHKQLEFLDCKIIQIQQDIREVIKLKSDTSITGNNESR